MEDNYGFHQCSSDPRCQQLRRSSSAGFRDGTTGFDLVYGTVAAELIRTHSSKGPRVATQNSIDPRDLRPRFRLVFRCISHEVLGVFGITQFGRLVTVFFLRV